MMPDLEIDSRNSTDDASPKKIEVKAKILKKRYNKTCNQKLVISKEIAASGEDDEQIDAQ